MEGFGPGQQGQTSALSRMNLLTLLVCFQAKTGNCYQYHAPYKVISGLAFHNPRLFKYCEIYWLFLSDFIVSSSEILLFFSQWTQLLVGRDTHTEMICDQSWAFSFSPSRSLSFVVWCAALMEKEPYNASQAEQSSPKSLCYFIRGYIWRLGIWWISKHAIYVDGSRYIFFWKVNFLLSHKAK